MKLIALALAATGYLMAAASSFGDTPPARSEVPIKEVRLSDGTHRYVVKVQVGSASIDAGLDTGSTGLRILPNALAPADAADSGQPFSYTFGSGVVLTGPGARGTVSIGGARGEARFQAVQYVSCVFDKPACPGNRLKLADYGLEGDGLPGEGFKAIIGISMASGEVDSPLPAMGAHRWIVELPLPGSRKPGRLVLNPTDEEIAGFIPFKIDPAFAHRQGGMHDAIPGCLRDVDSGQELCGPTLLDSGAPGIQVLNAPGEAWRNGTKVRLSFGGPSTPTISVSFPIGRRDLASDLKFAPQPAAKRTLIHSGVTAYFAYDILYDADVGVVALKRRADAILGAE